MKLLIFFIVVLGCFFGILALVAPNALRGARERLTRHIAGRLMGVRASGLAYGRAYCYPFNKCIEVDALKFLENVRGEPVSSRLLFVLERQSTPDGKRFLYVNIFLLQGPFADTMTHDFDSLSFHVRLARLFKGWVWSVRNEVAVGYRLRVLAPGEYTHANGWEIPDELRAAYDRFMICPLWHVSMSYAWLYVAHSSRVPSPCAALD